MTLTRLQSSCSLTANPLIDASSAARNVSRLIDIYVVNMTEFARSSIQFSASCENQNSDILEIRAELLRIVTLYGEVHLRASKRLFCNFLEFMSSYTDIDCQTFLECFEVVAEEASRYATEAELVADMHLHLYSSYRELTRHASSLRESLHSKISERKLEYAKQIESDKASKSKLLTVVTAAVTTSLALSSIARYNHGFFELGEKFRSIFPSPLAFIVIGGVWCLQGYKYFLANKRSQSQIYTTTWQDLEQAQSTVEGIIGPIDEFLKQCSVAISEVAVHFREVSNTVNMFQDKRVLEKHHAMMMSSATNIVYAVRAYLEVVPMVEDMLKSIYSNDSRSYRKYIQAWVEDHAHKLQVSKACCKNDVRATLWKTLMQQCPMVQDEEFIWVTVALDNRMGHEIIEKTYDVHSIIQAYQRPSKFPLAGLFIIDQGYIGSDFANSVLKDKSKCRNLCRLVAEPGCRKEFRVLVNQEGTVYVDLNQVVS